MSAPRPRVYDCFTFATELDILALRFELLDPVVDRFVLVEAPRTHSGINKPLHFAENRERFAAYVDKVTHVVVDDLPPPVPTRWVSEWFQRDAISRGLVDAAPDDLVLVSDVDELPDPDVVERLLHEHFGVAALEMRMNYYRANWEAPTTWPLARVARAGSFTSAQALRDSDPLLRVRNAGVHLSSVMDVAQIAEKYRSFAHAELDNDEATRADFLRSMQELRVFAPSRERLRVRQVDELDRVQRWLLERDPALFDFRAVATPRQKVGVAWAGLRSRNRVPDPVVRVGDATLATVLGVRAGALPPLGPPVRAGSRPAPEDPSS